MSAYYQFKTFILTMLGPSIASSALVDLLASHPYVQQRAEPGLSGLLSGILAGRCRLPA